jgi:hypothetical protein
MTWLAAITALLEIIANLPFVIKYLEKSLGPDWSKKKEVLQDAEFALKNAKTEEEEDAALIQLSRSMRSK